MWKKLSEVAAGGFIGVIVFQLLGSENFQAARTEGRLDFDGQWLWVPRPPSQARPLQETRPVRVRWEGRPLHLHLAGRAGEA